MRDGFLWCPHCAKPHALSDKFCPSTGKPIEAARASTTTSPTSTNLENLRSGEVVDGKFEIIATIGRGGAGVVYEAKHLALGLIVALKFLRKDSSESMLKRFEQEARLSASVGHPHICRVFDIGAFSDGARYMVMERLRGETLAHRLKRSGRLAPHLVIHLFSQVVSALAAAHAVDVIHRDIKPANLFIEMVPNVEPVAKILDFGCAKPLKGSAKVSQTGIAVGTTSYMSPEQVSFEKLDGRSDLFSCGATMYEALTGGHPFPGPTRTEVMAQIVRATYQPVLTIRPDSPTLLVDVINRALQKDRADRYQTASEMLSALRAIPIMRPSFVPERIVPSFADDPPSSSN